MLFYPINCFIKKLFYILPFRKEQKSCAVWGTQHYHTFDGKGFEYPGKCTYALAIDCRPGSDDFAVHVENGINCVASNQTCKRAAVIYINDIPHRLNPDETFSINGKTVALPFANADILVSKHADYIFFDAWNGKLLVKYDGQGGIYVQAADELTNGTCGLCGNFNGIPSDDYQLPSGKQTNSVLDFGNSWAKPKFGEMCHRELVVEDQCSSLSDLTKLLSDMRCKELKHSKLFEACRASIDPEPYYQKCLQEVCKCNGKSECVCGAFEQYSRECLRNGIVMNWRSNYLCRKI